MVAGRFPHGSVLNGEVVGGGNEVVNTGTLTGSVVVCAGGEVVGSGDMEVVVVCIGVVVVTAITKSKSSTRKR